MNKQIYALFLLLTVLYLSNVYADDSENYHLPEDAIARLGKGGINLIRFSPDGTKLAVGTDIGLWLYDVKKGVSSGLFTRELGQVDVLAFSKDGGLMASGGDGNPILQVWNLMSNKVHSSIELHRGEMALRALTFLNRLIYTIDGSTDMVSYNPDMGVKLSDNRFYSNYGLSTFSDDGATLAGVTHNGEIHLRDVKTGKRIAQLNNPEDTKKEEITILTFSPDGRILASGREDKSVHLWNTVKHEKITQLKGYKGLITAIAFSEDSKTIASADASKEITVWDIDTGTKKCSINGHKNTINTLTFSPSTTPEYGMCLASGSTDGTIRFWNSTNGNELTLFATGFTEILKAVAFSDDTTLVSASYNGVVNIWNLSTYDVEESFKIGQDDAVGLLTISSDCTLIVGQDSAEYLRSTPHGYEISRQVNKNNNIEIWSIPSAKKIVELPNESRYIYDAEFTPDSNIIALTSNTIKGYHILTETELFSLNTKKPSVEGNIVFSPDGNWIATVGPHTHPHVWNLESLDAPPKVSEKVGLSLAFSPDSNTLVMVGLDGMYLWKFKTNSQEMQTITSKKFGIFDPTIEFSPDGTKLIESAMSFDYSIRIWDIETGKVLDVLSGHTESVTTMAFSPDTKLLASGSYDGTVLVWDWEKISSKLNQ